MSSNSIRRVSFAEEYINLIEVGCGQAGRRLSGNTKSIRWDASCDELACDVAQALKRNRQRAITVNTCVNTRDKIEAVRMASHRVFADEADQGLRLL